MDSRVNNNTSDANMALLKIDEDDEIVVEQTSKVKIPN